MKTIRITVGSVTYALKLRRLLSRAGIPSRLIKVDSTESADGCAHGVEILTEHFYQAVVIMREKQIEYSVYEADK